VLLLEMIQEDLVKVGLEATSKMEAIEELVDVLIAAHEIRLTDRAEVMASLVGREKSISTGLEHGIAVPHGTVECVGDIVAALGTSVKGIPWESQDGKPSHIVVLILIPKSSFQRHVRTLAGIARLGQRQELRQRIVEARTAREVVDAVYSLEVAPDSQE
jgi:mannitol/fructose-specific phosphotransferase system IIA component (Ntr-type)